MFDTTTEFGSRAARRLRDEKIIWLTSVRSDGLPQPVPVWFLWENETFLIYTQPQAQKLRNINHNPKVSLHFDGGKWGDDIVIFTGEAFIDDNAPMVDQKSEYVEKYREGLRRINLSPEKMARDYSVAIRVRLTRLLG